MKDAPWVGNPPEPEYSGLKDFEGEPIFKDEPCLDIDGFIVPLDKKNDFMSWYLDNYRSEAKDYIWQVFEDTGQYIEA